ncbi:hypothetical protein DPX16_22637 [Anabarilius grahami]|uniref:Uncharacterized protein n=1 Tax=Anabarilius grahami TaxID=495550 RepID=A0A3N0Y5W6_ANAGA|nr:hypothetical protein DPX16_22637 [Anabarilius grahami]
MRDLLLLFSALLLLESTVGDKEYHQLNQYETDIIDRAIEEANERYGRTKHLDFTSIISEPRVSCVDCRGKMSCLPLREKTKVRHILVHGDKDLIYSPL